MQLRNRIGATQRSFRNQNEEYIKCQCQIPGQNNCLATRTGGFDLKSSFKTGK